MVHVLDRGALALLEHGLGEASTWWTVRTTEGTRPSPRSCEQGARRQAVLGVVHVGRRPPPAARRPARPRSAGCAPRRPRPRPPLHRHQARRHLGLAEEAGAVRRERPQLHVVAPLGQGLGQAEGVDHAAPRLGRVGDQADPHPTSAAARRAAAALVGHRRTPRSPSVASWGRAHLGVVLGPQHVGDHGELGPGAPGRSEGPGRAHRRGPGARRSRGRRRAAGPRPRGRPPPRRGARRAPRGRSWGAGARG